MTSRQKSGECRIIGLLMINQGGLALHNAVSGHIRHMLVHTTYHFLSAASMSLPNKAVV